MTDLEQNIFSYYILKHPVGAPCILSLACLLFNYSVGFFPYLDTFVHHSNFFHP